MRSPHPSSRDARRRALGQNFLADPVAVRSLIAGLDLRPGELVVDLGAGSGALTMPMVRAGARVTAVETDAAWVARLHRCRDEMCAEDRARLRVVHCDLRRFRLPAEPHRVVANPPFALSTDVLRLLLDDPSRGPTRADLVLQREVAHKRAAQVPTSLLSASWAPWWEFAVTAAIDRRSFRPVPAVDAAVLRISRRTPPVLPEWLAPGFADVLRGRWEQHG